MRIYNEVVGLAFDYTFGVVEYRVSINDHIERKFIGQQMKILARGTPLWQTTVTIRGDRDDVGAFREALKNIMILGYSFRIGCQTYEPIFGPEFVYSGGINLMEMWVVDPGEQAYVTDSSPDHVPTEWTFTFGPKLTPTAYYLYNPVSFPSTVLVQSVSRTKNAKTAPQKLYSMQSANGFYVFNPISIVTWQGPKDEIAKAKCYLLRNALLTGGTVPVGDRAWFFGYGETSIDESVYLLAIEDMGPISKGSDEFQFSATLAQVVLA